MSERQRTVINYERPVAPSRFTARKVVVVLLLIILSLFVAAIVVGRQLVGFR